MPYQPFRIRINILKLDNMEDNQNQVVPVIDTVDDVAMQIAAAVNVVNNVTTSVTDTIKYIADVKVQLNKLTPILIVSSPLFRCWKNSSTKPPAV